MLTQINFNYSKSVVTMFFLCILITLYITTMVSVFNLLWLKCSINYALKLLTILFIICIYLYIIAVLSWLNCKWERSSLLSLINNKQTHKGTSKKFIYCYFPSYWDLFRFFCTLRFQIFITNYTSMEILLFSFQMMHKSQFHKRSIFHNILYSFYVFCNLFVSMFR